MRLHTELHEWVLPCAQPGKIRQGAKPKIGHDGKEHGRHEGHQRLYGANRGHDANACQCARKHHQPQIAPPYRPQIEVPCRGAQHPQNEDVRQGGQQRCQRHRPTAQEFGQDHLPLGQRTGEQQFKGPAAMLLRERPHGHSGHQEHQHPWCHGKKRGERSHPTVEDIPTTWEQPQKQTGEKQKDGHHSVADQRAEKALNFFKNEGPHGNQRSKIARDKSIPEGPGRTWLLSWAKSSQTVPICDRHRGLPCFPNGSRFRARKGRLGR